MEYAIRFRYVAYNADGRETRGVIEADSESGAEELLWQANLIVARLSRQMALPSLEEALPTLFGVKRQDLVVFSRDLASLLAAGIPLLQSLRMLRDQTRKASLRRVLSAIMASLESGRSFSQACAEHPQVFPTLYFRLIEIGEEIGSLELVLRQITTYYEKELAVQSKIRGALTYPFLVILLSIASIIILVNVVLPAMKGLFTEFKADLPVSTRILVGGADILQKYGIFFLIGAIAVVLLLWLYIRTSEGRRRRDYFTLMLPLIGEVAIKSHLSRLARTLSILLKAGVSITESLNLMVQTTPNIAVRETIQAVNEDVKGGRLLSQAMASRPLFPSLLVQVSSVGEQTGRLEANLESLATFYEQEVDRLVGRLVGLIEPMLILGAGGLVGFIAVSMISAMYGVLGHIE